ncbi:MAG: kinase [Candidatus Bathyarchaeia archaeon]
MRVYVKTPARLHLGIINPTGSFGRMYGSIGVAVDRPNVVLEASPNREIEVVGDEAELAEAAAKRFLRFHGIDAGVRLVVRQMIPRHVGLGSGTQLSLAVAAALSKLLGVGLSVRQLAAIMGRGSISGIGTAAFEGGGFILDGGLRCGDGVVAPTSGIPPLLVRRSFPEDWFFVVAIPGVGRGLSGETEISVFKEFKCSDVNLGEICRLILMRMLPALEEEDIEVFGESLTRIQRFVGEFFRNYQGGIFGSLLGAECIDLMLREGAYGVGQSSWGPAVYGLVRGLEAARSLTEVVWRFISRGVGGLVFHAAADNRGAQISVE